MSSRGGDSEQEKGKYLRRRAPQMLYSGGRRGKNGLRGRSPTSSRTKGGKGNKRASDTRESLGLYRGKP